jgi:hypothetical protein
MDFTDQVAINFQDEYNAYQIIKNKEPGAIHTCTMPVQVQQHIDGQ